MCQKDCYHGPVNYLPMYVNKQILCNYNVDCNPQDFLFVGTDYVAVTIFFDIFLISKKSECPKTFTDITWQRDRFTRKGYFHR